MLLKSAIYLAVIVTSLALAVNVSSQSNLGLVLRAERTGSVTNCAGQQQGYECLKFRMIFENRGKEPAIIINPTLGFGTGIKEVRNFYREFGPEPGSYVEVEARPKLAVRDPVKDDSFRSIASSFDSDRPVPNYTIVILPGDSFTFEEMFLVASDTRIPEKDFEAMSQRHPAGSTCDQRGCVRTPSGRRLVYEFSFRRYIEDPEFLNKLTRRWKIFGRLPVSDDGAYEIVSEMTRVVY